MEGNVGLRVVAALLAFGGAAVLGSAVARRLAKRYRSAAYSIGGEKNRAGWVSWLVRNGVGLMRSVARAVLRNARVRASVANLLTAVEGIGFIATEESLLSLVLTAMLIVGVGDSALTAAPICGVALALCVAAACAIYAKSSEDKRRERMREAVPDALRSMAVCFRSGQSLLQTMQQVGAATKGPVGVLFRRAASPSRNGRQHTRGTLGFPREELGSRARLRFRCA